MLFLYSKYAKIAFAAGAEPADPDEVLPRPSSRNIGAYF